MHLILTKTFTTITPESAEDGEFADSGILFAKEPYTLRETVDLIKSDGYFCPSDSHGIPRWVSAPPEQDYRTGEEIEYSLHPDLEDRATARLWPIALRIALGIRPNSTRAQ